VANFGVARESSCGGRKFIEEPPFEECHAEDPADEILARVGSG
jgi:hypothetical protein